MRVIRDIPLFIFVMAALLLSPLASAQDQAQELAITRLVIEAGDGPKTFEVEFASTSDERRVGLMYRTEMADDHGMIFSYPKPRVISMWMKNTFIPLDIIFIRRNGQIANMVENTTPGSLDSIVSQGRVIGVLELNAGMVERLGIERGDLVRHEMFSNMSDVPE